MGELTLPIRSPPELALAGRPSSDERLARLVSRGSARAFAALYQRHHQALYRYCRSIVRDEDDAQDALQSAMTRALVALRAEESAIWP
jgi:DNA-directed RNA polymerase specialized sigma24 family protein